MTRLDHEHWDVGDAAALNRRWRGASATAVLAAAIAAFRGRIALVSSFGAESAVLLHLAAEIDRDVPVLFLDTGKHFDKTLDHRARLTAQLGLRDVRLIAPNAEEMRVEDPSGDLHSFDPDACCALRKTRPLERALAGFDAWVTGRKRFQTTERLSLPAFETDADGRIKVNPLANWTPGMIDAYLDAHALPRHPLTAQGFRSIGCAPCTTPVADGEDHRAGRWRGRAKAECGIHIHPDGRIERVPAAAVAPFDR